MAAAGLLLALPLLALEVPAGTELHLRLQTKVSSVQSKPKDPVEAIVILPVAVNGQFAIPAGAKARGTVQEVKRAPGPDQRAVLGLDFSELEFSGQKLKLACRVSGVDNAREIVDDHGRILGILGGQTISGRLDEGIGKVTEKHSGLGDFLQIAKGVVLKATESDIEYEPGVEFTVTLTKPLQVSKPGSPGPAGDLEPLSNDDQLLQIVLRQPFQTRAENPPKPSDITNLMFVGSEDRVEAAFADAGWSTAAALNAQSKLETFRSIAELRGYKEAPVSILLLDGKPPDLVFQKQNNTFAQRHHLRIWKRPDQFQGQPVWVCAATHDIGIDFSEENRTFIHKIDSNIDAERSKVVNDLLLTGKVRSLALVDRPAVPRDSKNATGDELKTDGRMAVLILK